MLYVLRCELGKNVLILENLQFNARGLYLLKQDIAHFDNQFFNVSPLEAKSIDPQQRLLLESAYEAFENAGVPIAELSSSETGVYCAVCNHDYEKILGRDPELSPKYIKTVPMNMTRISRLCNILIRLLTCIVSP